MCVCVCVCVCVVCTYTYVHLCVETRCQPLQLLSSSFKIKNKLYAWVYCMPMCLCVTCVLCPWRLNLSYLRLIAAIWLLGVGRRSSGRAAGALNHWAISPAPPLYFLRQGLSLNVTLSAKARLASGMSVSPSPPPPCWKHMSSFLPMC